MASNDDEASRRSQGAAPALASLSLGSSRPLLGAQASRPGRAARPNPLGDVRTPAGNRSIPFQAPHGGCEPRPVAALTAAAAAAAATSGRQKRRGHAWQLQLAAGIGLFQIARLAAAHLLAPAHAQQRPAAPLQDRRVSPSPAPAAAGPGGDGRPGAPAARKPALVWFRNDLRLHDHEPLARANAEATSLVPVYCFDPREYGKSPSGFDKTGPYRARFILEALSDLRRRLRDAGSDLLVRLGKPEDVLPRLARAVGAGAVYCHGEVTREEQQVERALSAALDRLGSRLVTCWGGTLYHRDDLPFQLRDMPPSYGEFRQRVNGLSVRAPFAPPSSVKGLPAASKLDAGELPTLLQLGLSPAAVARSAGDRAAVAAGLKGGETQALDQLAAFVSELARLAGGGAGAQGPAAAGVPPPPGRAGGGSSDARGGSFSCRISPWLAMGCLSPREMYHQLLKQPAGPAAKDKAGQHGGGKPGDMSWLLFELMWRDFFRFVTEKYSGVGSAASAAQSQPAPAMQPALA